MRHSRWHWNATTVQRVVVGWGSLMGTIRALSSQQVAVALRPFYFAVHPDRFAHNPDVKAQNEHSLKAFNGYMNDLFPLRKLAAPDPVKVEFYLAEKNVKKLRKVQIELSGSDARSIVIAVLHKCNLPTKNVPTMSSPSSSSSASISGVHSNRTRNMFDSEEMNAAEEMLRMYRKKHSAYFVQRNDLTAALREHKDAATQATKAFEKTSKLLQEDMNELRERAGIKEIIWLTNWAKSYMRRCLVSVNRLIDHAPPSDGTNPIIQALQGYCLRFGRCSYVCCDGGVQFGVQDVPEEWEHICAKASIQRRQLADLRGARARLSQLMGNAHILTLDERCLAQTLTQIQSLIIRILARDESERTRLETLGKDTLIEVVSAYDELAIGKDGRLLVPCNSAVERLIGFLNEKAHLSRQINATLHQLQYNIENVRRDCIDGLKLKDLTWQQGISLEELLSSMQRLLESEQSLRELLADVWLHFDMNPTIYVMTDGRLSVPLQWI